MEPALIEAVRKGKNGDKQALTEIYNATNRMVYFNALKLLQNEEDAQDIVQETYIQAFQNLSGLQDEKAFIKWLKTIVINLSKNALKKCKPTLFDTDEREELTLGSIPETSEEFLPAEYAVKKEKCRLIMNMVDKLPDAQRTAVLLYYFNELSLEEVARIMETKEGTIKSRLNYARKKIKEEVEEQERQGTKLYGVPIVPLMSRILQNASLDYTLPTEVSKTILSASLECASSLGKAGAAASGGGSAVVQSASGASAKAASGLLVRFMAKPLAAKIAAGIIAAAVMVGSGMGISHMVGNKESEVELWKKAYVECVEALHGREWDELLGMTKDEITAILGEPHEIRDNGDEFVYKDKKTGYQILDISFYEDGTATSISGNVPGFSLKGVKVGDTLKQAKAVFSKSPGAIPEKEDDSRGSLSAFSFSLGEDYTYDFLYDEDEIVRIIAVSKHHIIYSTSPEPVEPVEKERATQTPTESQQPAETIDNEKLPTPSKGSSVRDIYKDYFIGHFSGTNAQAFFADLTHDGQEEMLVVYGDLMEGYLEVYTVDNGKVSLIHELYTATMTNYNYGIGLYQEDGKDYIMYFGLFERQGHPLYVYDIYHIDKKGTIDSLHKRTLEFYMDESGNRYGVTEKESERFDRELDTYGRKSQLLVAGGYFPGEEPSLDVIYGKGESFRQTEAVDKIALDRLLLKDDMAILKALEDPSSVDGYQMLFDGLAIYKNYGGNDTFHITSGRYSVHGVYVGQSKKDVLKALDDTKMVQSNNVTCYVFRDTNVSDSFELAVVPIFSGDRVSELYYRVYFED